MSFFDDLKKPVVKAEPQQKQFVIWDREREQVVDALWNHIRSGCETEKRSGKRVYRHNYACFLQDGVYKFGPYGGPYTDRHYRNVSFVHTDNSPRYDTNGSWLRTFPRPRFLDDEPVVSYYEVLWNAAERDKILQLLRQKLVADGFPADAVRAHEYVYGGEGTGIIKRNEKTMPIIKVDVNW